MSSEQNEQKLSPFRWVVWGTLIAVYLTVFFHRVSVGVITGDLEETFGMSATQIANLGAMYFYAYTVMQIPTGILADHLGPKKTVIMGSIVAAIGSITFSMAGSISIAYFGRLLVGIGVSVVFLSVLKIQANWFPAKNFASMSGLTSFTGTMGGVLAQAPLIAMVGLIGWRGSFLAIGIITIVFAILVGILVKNTPTEKGLPEVNPQQTQPIEEKTSIMSQLLGIVKNPRIWFPALAFGGINGGFMLFAGTFGVSYIVTVYGLSKTIAANYISILLIVGGIACLIIGKVSDSLKRRKLPMVILSVLAVVAWGILIFANPPVWFIPVFVTLIGVSGSLGVVCWSVGKEVSDPKLAGMSMSIVNVCGFFFAALLPVICGKLIDTNIAAGLTPAMAYPKAFSVPTIASILALGFALFSTETKCENVYTKKDKNA
ncbi:MFS transporter [Bacillus sp. FJAT-29790]|uniref:MFS transporter n=1 Tax=Bacillus sp. FJAT-29790 TaxID=1895002 RepID=UPI001C238963|nr:MFS transporter [Bacillus sp. FJAT-29790]MBU8880551.1 MFS transporter [Bacillus sp. FJAT-29790]